MLNDGTMHDEIIYKGRLLIVDTVDLGWYYSPVRFETMAMWEDGSEVEIARAETEQEARRVHARMLGKYNRQASELTGKYAKLAVDLSDALSATADVEQTEDSGTCNFDSPTLFLPRWNGEKIKQAAKAAGCGAWKWEHWGTSEWVFSIPSSGQANRRSRRAEAVCKALREMGYNAAMYYAMD